MNDISKKDDEYSMRSAKALKEQMAKEIKKVFTRALSCIEIRFGDDFDGFERIRKDILDTGNNAIRDIEKQIDDNYNIEVIPKVLEFKKR